MLKSLQTNQPVLRKATKRIADETNEVTKRNTSSAVVQSVSSSAKYKPVDQLPASIRNIHQLSSMNSQMTNGGRSVKQMTQNDWLISRCLTALAAQIALSTQEINPIIYLLYTDGRTRIQIPVLPLCPSKYCNHSATEADSKQTTNTGPVALS